MYQAGRLRFHRDRKIGGSQLMDACLVFATRQRLNLRRSPQLLQLAVHETFGCDFIGTGQTSFYVHLYLELPI